MEKIKVSVIVPIYNSEQYLEKCLDSLLSQSLREIEIICVDDGSTDRSCRILDEYAMRDERVHVLHQKNQYAGMARNNGLSVAKGEYVIFLDSDDFFDKSLLKKIYLKAKSTEADIVIFGAEKYNMETKAFEKTMLYFNTAFLPKKKVFSRKDVPEHIMMITTPVPWTKLYNKNFVQQQNLQFQSLQNSNDAYFTLLAMCVADRISYVKEDLVYYRVGQKNNLQSRKSRYPTCFVDAYTALYEELRRRGIFFEVEKSYVEVVLSGCSYNLDTITDPSARLKIYKAISGERFLASGILEHPKSYYPDKRQYDQVKRCLELWQPYARAWESSMKKNLFSRVVDSKEDEPKVSIIIPVYNVEKYIEECLESVCRQTMKDIEIIVVNDGTQDNSMEKVSLLSYEDPRIKIINKANGGLSSARNEGLKAAKGEYILFLDSDDKLYELAIEVLYDQAKSMDLDELFFGAIPFCDSCSSENDYNRYVDYYKRKSDYSGVWKGTVLFSSFVENDDFKPSACLQLLKKFFLEKNNITFLEGILHEDNLFTMQCLLKAEKAGVIDLDLYFRRIHDNSIMTQRKRMRNVYGYFISIIEMLKTIELSGLKQDDLYVVALEKQFDIMINVSLDYLQEISRNEMEDWLKRLSIQEQILFYFLIRRPMENREDSKCKRFKVIDIVKDKLFR